MPRSNAHRLQIAQNCNSHFCSPVLDWTIRSGPNFLKTGLDCGLGVPDRTVRSFLWSPFPSDKKTGLYGPVSLKPDRTAVWGCWTVRSGLFQRSTKKATVQTGPDRGQSRSLSPVSPCSHHTVTLVTNPAITTLATINPVRHVTIPTTK